MALHELQLDSFSLHHPSLHVIILSEQQNSPLPPVGEGAVGDATGVAVGLRSEGVCDLVGEGVGGFGVGAVGVEVGGIGVGAVGVGAVGVGAVGVVDATTNH